MILTVDEDGVLHGPFLRSAYNYNMDYASEQSGLKCEDPTLAQQQFAEECDINTIVERFGLTGQMPTGVKMPMQGDFMDAMDYQSALNRLLEAEEAFMQFPAHIRAEFQNDAGKFVDFVSDEKNVEKCREWGLAKPAPIAAAPVMVKVMPADPEAS